jgi:hypothetical protein
MTNPKLGFADDVKRLLAMFPGIVAYADEAAKTGSLEQAAQEAEARIAKAKADFERQAVDEQARRSSHLNRVAEAERNAEAAKEKADGVIAAARADAGKIIEAARKQADGMVADANQLVAASQQTLAAVNAEITKAKTSMEAARDARSIADAELAAALVRKKDAETAIAALKSRL